MLKWKIRKYRIGDEKGISRLFEETYNLKQQLEYWNWKYRGGKEKFSRIIISEDNEKIVGCYSLIVYKMKVNDEVVDGSIAVDAAVHPDYQRQGMFVKMGKVLFDKEEIPDIKLTIGFPNEKAIPGHKKLGGWIEAFRIPLWVKPLEFNQLISVFTRNKYLKLLGAFFFKIFCFFYCFGKRWKLDGSDYKIEKIDYFSDEINEFWDKISTEHKIITVRDSEFLNWRYVKQPDINYKKFVYKVNNKVVGFIVFTEYEMFGFNMCLIMDLLVLGDNKKVFFRLVDEVSKFSSKMNLSAVGCLMLPNLKYAKWLRKNAFIKIPLWFPLKRFHFIIRDIHHSYDAKFLANQDNWYISFGDSDVVWKRG